MINIGIIGHTGRLGKPLFKILSNHPYANISYFQSTDKKSKSDISDTELVFLALPYGQSEEYILQVEGKKIIDLSIDHRLNSNWVYGLPELNRDKIITAERIASPGCYATSVLEALLPIRNLLTDIEIIAYSGVSGRPNQPIIEDGGIERYAKDREHHQVAEIEKYLGMEIKSFEPHLVYPLDTGIVAIINAQIQDPSKVQYSFEDKPFVSLVDFELGKGVHYLNKTLTNVKNSNNCHVSYCVEGKSITIISALDNLIKGGAGQAVQNFNLMYGFEETTALMKT